MSLNEWMIVLSSCSPVILATGILLGLLYFKKVDNWYKPVIYYLSWALFTDIAGRILGVVMGYNLFIIPVFGLLELALFLELYVRYFLSSRTKLHYYFLAAFAVLVGVEVWYDITEVNTKLFHSYSKTLASLAIVLLTLRYMTDVLQQKLPSDKEKLKMNAIVLIYFSVNLIIFMTVNYLINASLQVVIYFWILNLISAVLFYATMTYMLWQNGRTRKRLQSGSALR